MIPLSIKIDQRLNEKHALQLAADLAQIEPNAGDIVCLDFSVTHHFEPFAMLFAGSAIRRLRHRLKSANASLEFKLPNDSASGIAAHMGFWHSVGEAVGRPVNSPAGRESNLPITCIEVAELYQEAGGRDPQGAMIVEKRAGNLATILAGPEQNTALIEALTYALRELIRNVIEHAMTPQIWLAGMTWPGRGYIQIAVLDEGRGIRSSLATHPDYRFETDIEALRESLRAGVTRNKGRKSTSFQIERWADEGHLLPLTVFENTGYGLYMISTFCQAAGQFLIASGSSSLKFFTSADVPGSTLHKGTAISMVVEPARLQDAFNELFTRSGNSGTSATSRMLSASKLRKLGLDSLIGDSSAD